MFYSSQGIRAGNTVYVSGQLGLDPKTGDFVTGGVKEQCHQALKNIGAILTAAEMNYSNG